MTLKVNGEVKNIESSNSNPKKALNILELLKILELPLDHLAVELNRNIVPKKQFESTKLSDDDQVEILRFVGGG